MYYIGIDNGVSGTIGIVCDCNKYNGHGEHTVDCKLPIVIPTPTRKERSYTKTTQNITRIDTDKLIDILWDYAGKAFVFMERPMVNPARFKATASALRALEATLIALRYALLDLPIYIDSKQWQGFMLPGVKGSENLKKAAVARALREYPELGTLKDADGLMIAEYCRYVKTGYIKNNGTVYVVGVDPSAPSKSKSVSKRLRIQCK